MTPMHYLTATAILTDFQTFTPAPGDATTGALAAFFSTHAVDLILTEKEPLALAVAACSWPRIEKR